MVLTANQYGVVTFGADTLNVIDIETGHVVQTAYKNEIETIYVDEGELVTIGQALADIKD